MPFLLRVLASERRDFQFERIQARALDALADFDVRSPEVLAGLRAFLAAEPGNNGAAAKRVLEKLTR